MTGYGIIWYRIPSMDGIKQYQMNNPLKIVSLRANIPEPEKNELEIICSVLDVPIAQIIREGVREKVASLKENHPKVREALSN